VDSRGKARLAQIFLDGRVRRQYLDCRRRTVATGRRAVEARRHLLAMAEREGIDLNHEQRGIWVAAPDARPEDEEIVPLAMLPPGALYRDLALEALDGTRKWRIVCASESIAGLQAAVFAGLAVSVVARCAVVPGMRILSAAENMPPLPAIHLMLHHGANKDLPAVARLADHVVEQIGEKV
jgi:hypothetical protein